MVHLSGQLSNLRKETKRLLTVSRDGDVNARRLIAEGLASYSSQLMSHVAKENNVLFRLADRAQDEDDRRWLAAEFERAERKEGGAATHERHLAMAEALALRAGWRRPRRSSRVARCGAGPPDDHIGRVA